MGWLELGRIYKNVYLKRVFFADFVCIIQHKRKSICYIDDSEWENVMIPLSTCPAIPLSFWAGLEWYKMNPLTYISYTQSPDELLLKHWTWMFGTTKTCINILFLLNYIKCLHSYWEWIICMLSQANMSAIVFSDWWILFFRTYEIKHHLFFFKLYQNQQYF